MHPFPLALVLVHDEGRGEANERTARLSAGIADDAVAIGSREAASREVLRAIGAAGVLRGVRAIELLRGFGIGEVRMSVTAETTAPGGHSASSNQLWADVHERLRAFIRRRVSDPHAADDLAQEVLLRLYRNIDRLRQEDRLDAFAYGIARNAITDHYRARAREKEIPSAPTSLAARIEADSGDEQQAEDAEGRQQLARCMEPLAQRLPEPYREALMLTDLGDRSQTQAARLTGLSVPGMKARVQRARAQVRELLAECCEVQLDRSRRIAEVERIGPCACSQRAAGSHRRS
jgi:RNA polymerase sigma-70 factor (ECF subfamily)